VSDARLRARIAELVTRHGSLRATGRALQIDAAYLSRLARGEKDNPDDAILRKLGLRRVVTYVDLRKP
jgi:hypothetical protein